MGVVTLVGWGGGVGGDGVGMVVVRWGGVVAGGWCD